MSQGWNQVSNLLGWLASDLQPWEYVCDITVQNSPDIGNARLTVYPSGSPCTEIRAATLLLKMNMP